MLVPADGVDVLPHQVHHRGQGEDGDEPKKLVNLENIRDSSPDSEAEEEGPTNEACVPVVALKEGHSYILLSNMRERIFPYVYMTRPNCSVVATFCFFN